MGNVIIQVDAGYLYAAGSAELCGGAQPRHNLILNISAVVDALKALAHDRSEGQRLLRIYWYDGSNPSTGRSTEHALLATHEFVKLRLGLINSFGKQKGVDSSIVSDLIELARHRAIDDVVLLAGDEDVRIGVQIAQTLGVRVHLLGIRPSTGNQAPTLREEADTKMEWNKVEVERFLSLKKMPQTTPDADGRRPAVIVAQDDDPLARIVIAVREHIASAYSPQDQEKIRALLAENPNSIPRDIDRQLLPRCRNAVGRDLTDGEKRAMRRAFRDEHK